MKKIVLVPVIIAVLLPFVISACTAETLSVEPTFTPIPPTPATPAEVRAVFNYDPLQPLEVDWGEVNEKDGVEVQTISYASTMGDRVPAYFVKPAGAGPFPAVIFLHCGHNTSCNKTEFIYEANQLAKRGIASLSIDGPLRRISEANFEAGSMFIYSVQDVMRAVDLVGSLPEIDGGKIGYVGHSYGATTGGILAGVDTRITAFVFMAGHAQVSIAAGPESIDYLDAIHYIPYASHASLLFQSAEQDRFVSREGAKLFYEVASEPKEIRWYDTDHDFNSEARNDRLDWLVDHLQ